MLYAVFSSYNCDYNFEIITLHSVLTIRQGRFFSTTIDIDKPNLTSCHAERIQIKCHSAFPDSYNIAT